MEKEQYQQPVQNALERLITLENNLNQLRAKIQPHETQEILDLFRLLSCNISGIGQQLSYIDKSMKLITPSNPTWRVVNNSQDSSGSSCGEE